MSRFNSILVLLAVAFALPATIYAQAKNKTAKAPASFTVSLSDIRNIQSAREGQTLRSRSAYLASGVVVKNAMNGDMQYVRTKLPALKNAFLVIQVNGTFSTQYFIESTDKSVFYKGTRKGEVLTLKKCPEDEIVSE